MIVPKNVSLDNTDRYEVTLPDDEVDIHDTTKWYHVVQDMALEHTNGLSGNVGFITSMSRYL